MKKTVGFIKHIFIFYGAFLCVIGFSSLASGKDRNVAVDESVGGMEQGRRIQSPGSYSNKGVASGQPGSTTGSITDRHTALQESEKTTTTNSQSKNISDSGNQGFLYRAGREQTIGSSTASTRTESSGQTSAGQERGSANVGSDQIPSGSGQEGIAQSNKSTNVNAGETSSGLPGDQTDPTSGSVNVGTTETRSSGQAWSTGQTTGSVEITTPQAGTEQSDETQPFLPAGQSGEETTASVETEGNGGVLVGEETSPAGETETQTPSDTSNNPIIDVDANVNPESGAVDTDVQTDTSGELEDRQIIDAGATTGQTSTQTQTGSATEITGSETVHETDITIQPVTETTGQTGDTTTSLETEGNGGIFIGGQTSPTGQVETGEIGTGSETSGTSTEESSSDSSNPIVGVDAQASPESGSVDTDVQIDTSGELEDRQIIDAGITTGETATQTETGSATEITGSETVHETDITIQPVTEVTAETGSTDTGTETGNGGIFISGETSPTGQVETGEISTGTESSSGISNEESASDSSNPIVGVDVQISPESDTIEADTTIDTSGELEERQILDADLTGETTGSVGAEIGSAVDITAADLVEEANITTELVTETIGQLDAEHTSGPGSDTSSDTIVDLDVNISPESGTIDTNVDLDLSGEIEDTQILELDLVAEDVVAIETDLSSASQITDSETVSSVDVTPETTESLIPAPADLVAEIDTTGQTVGGEVDIGIAADVEGMSEGEDVVSDPADGLNL
jgi:hypothetical protein